MNEVRASRMNAPSKVVLPAVMGLVCAALMVWDIHNQRIIMSMGMAWDTGAPLWPYQTPDILLFALNLPAYFITNPISRQFNLFVPERYFVLFPVIVLWWWLVGRYLDRRLLKENVRRAPIQAIMFALLAIALIALGVEEASGTLKWWFIYSRTLISVTDLILLRSLAPTVWGIILGFVCLHAAWKRLRYKASVPP
jgi:hypothetical protein